MLQSTLAVDPVVSGLEHIVVVTMENRSFDHMLGWLAGSDGQQAGLSYLDRTGTPQATYPLAPDFQGCGHPNPDHSFAGGRAAYADGACDGWLVSGANDTYAIGYYTRADLPFLGPAALAWTTCDRYFAAIMSETYPNRIYMHAGQTDRLDDSLGLCTLPTVWDRLADRRVSARYYFSDLPTLGLWGLRYASICRPKPFFFADCATGRLPAVSFLDPSFLFEQKGLSSDDHPPADIRNGEAFLSQVYAAVTSSPAWPSTLLVMTFDEWGGFFDHVPPQAAPIPDADQRAGNSDGLRGFRVPCVLISPWSRRGFVSSILFDHTSILRLIEWRWGLEPLTVRDSNANNLAEALDFGLHDVSTPTISAPRGPFGGPCPPDLPGAAQPWQALRDFVRQEAAPLLSLL
jgi:phospholipase C